MRGILDGMVGCGSDPMAVMLLSDLKQMFRWAEKRKPWKKLIEDNPVEQVEAEKITSDDYEGSERVHTLSAEEIRGLAAKLPYRRPVAGYRNLHVDYDVVLLPHWRSHQGQMRAYRPGSRRLDDPKREREEQDRAHGLSVVIRAALLSPD